MRDFSQSGRGISTAFVDETVDIIAEANAVPAALWKDAVARGLLAPDLLAL